MEIEPAVIPKPKVLPSPHRNTVNPISAHDSAEKMAPVTPEPEPAHVVAQREIAVAASQAADLELSDSGLIKRRKQRASTKTKEQRLTKLVLKITLHETEIEDMDDN